MHLILKKYNRVFIRFFIFFIFFHASFFSFAKDPLVFLPIVTDLEERKQFLENSLSQGLSKKYELFYGQAVKDQLEIEYQKVDCTAESCAQNLALHFGSELIAEAEIRKFEVSFIVSFNIKNIITKQTVFSSTETCTECTFSQLIEFLKLFGAGELNKSSNSQIFSNNFSGRASATKIEKIFPKISNSSTGNNTTTLYFETDQKDVKVYINDVLIQTIKNSVFQRQDIEVNQQITLTLVKKNYLTRRFQFRTKKGINHLGKLNLLKNIGYLNIQSLPEKADVFIAGEKVGQTPLEIELEVGKVVLDIKKLKYQKMTFSMNIENNKTAQRVIRLIKNTGNLIVQTNPKDAEVSILNLRTEELLQLTTPIDLEIEAGQYQVKISKDGYRSEIFQVEIQKNQITKISELQSKLIKLNGFLTVLVEPAQKNVAIKINNQNAGFAPLEKKLPKGEYHIEAETDQNYAQEKIFLPEEGYKKVVLKLNEKSIFPTKKEHFLGLEIGTMQSTKEVTGDNLAIKKSSFSIVYQSILYPQFWEGNSYFFEFGGGVNSYELKKDKIDYTIPDQPTLFFGVGFKLPGVLFSRYSLRFNYLEDKKITPSIKNVANLSKECDCVLKAKSFGELLISILDINNFKIKAGFYNQHEKTFFSFIFSFGTQL